MSSFEDLMATLNAIDADAPAELAKSTAAQSEEELAKACKSEAGAEAEEGDDDKKIQAASDEGDSDKKDESEEEEEGEGKPFGKSMVNEEGEEVIDATEILEGLQKSFASHDYILAKAMPKMVELLGAQSKALKDQGDMIKSLQDQLASFGSRPAGRKSMVTVLAKSTVAEQPAVATAAEEAPMTMGDVMVKANSLFDQKLLSGLQLTKLDVALRNGYMPDADIMAVLAKH